MFSLKMFELLIFDSLGSHSDNFFDKGVFGNKESTLLLSEKFSDLLNLARTDISKVNQDYLLMLTKQSI